jgi:hypothetical protein
MSRLRAPATRAFAGGLGFGGRADQAPRARGGRAARSRRRGPPRTRTRTRPPLPRPATASVRHSPKPRNPMSWPFRRNRGRPAKSTGTERSLPATFQKTVRELQVSRRANRVSTSPEGSSTRSPSISRHVPPDDSGACRSDDLRERGRDLGEAALGVRLPDEADVPRSRTRAMARDRRVRRTALAPRCLGQGMFGRTRYARPGWFHARDPLGGRSDDCRHEDGLSRHLDQPAGTGYRRRQSARIEAQPLEPQALARRRARGEILDPLRCRTRKLAGVGPRLRPRRHPDETCRRVPRQHEAARGQSRERGLADDLRDRRLEFLTLHNHRGGTVRVRWSRR